MNPVATQHLITEREQRDFERDGFLLLPGAIDVPTQRILRSAARREDDRYRAGLDIGPHHVLNLHDLLPRDPAWLEMLDWSTTFPKVWGVLGWNIQLFHTQLLITPPAPPGSRPGAYGWHQDNNRMNLDLETTPQPRISVKVGYFLSDLPAGGMGNLCVVPGSHHRARPELHPDEQPDGMIEVLANTGDAILFDRRLWHAASTNCSQPTRTFVTFGYSYRWLRPKSRMQHDHLREVVDPVRRQLLGWSTDAAGYFEPTNDDVPLREWIRRNLGDAHVAP